MLFLKMLLFDQMRIDQPSLQQHCASIFNEHHKKLSKQGLDKRFNAHSVKFVQKLLELYLENQLAALSIPSAFSEHFSAIRIMDSTEFKLPECLASDFPGFDGDGTKSCTQIQFEYDILSGKVNHLAIGDARTPDFAYAKSYLNSIQSNELIIRDLGYSRIDSFKEIQKKEAYYMSRLHPSISLFEKRGKDILPLSYPTILKRLKRSGKEYLDILVYLGIESKHPVRLTANLLNPEAIERSLTKKIYRKNATNRKYKCLSQMNLFITNISKEMLPADHVYSLYSVRWQIELIFKTWKSVLKIDHVHKMKATRFKCYLLSKLLWILMSWEICSLFNENVRRKTRSLLSVYKCFAIIKDHAFSMRDILSGQKEKLIQWLKNLYDILSKFGLKENKKGRKNLIELLGFKYI